MNRLVLAFEQAQDERFVVRATVQAYTCGERCDYETETWFDHEDTFLRLLIEADLDEGVTRELVIAVIKTVAQPETAQAPLQVELSDEQNAVLGLKIAREADRGARSSEAAAPAMLPYLFRENLEQFHHFLMNSPTPFVMLSGPEHTVTFINMPYVRILGRSSADQILGRPVLEALPELNGQVCLEILERAYHTGVAQTRRELPCHFLQAATGRMEDVYFDIVYHPVRDHLGQVSGIMAQATDVTERVLAREVSEHREQKLYRLWIELEVIYYLVPVGLAMIDATDLRIMRINTPQAELLGGKREELVGRVITELALLPELEALVHRARAGESVHHFDLQQRREELRPAKGWRVSVRPTLNGSGVVETITVISVPAELEQRQELMALSRT